MKKVRLTKVKCTITRQFGGSGGHGNGNGGSGGQSGGGGGSTGGGTGGRGR